MYVFEIMLKCLTDYSYKWNDQLGFDNQFLKTAEMYKSIMCMG